jgi:hypothetical protein
MSGSPILSRSSGAELADDAVRTRGLPNLQLRPKLMAGWLERHWRWRRYGSKPKTSGEPFTRIVILFGRRGRRNLCPGHFFPLKIKTEEKWKILDIIQQNRSNSLDALIRLKPLRIGSGLSRGCLPVNDSRSFLLIRSTVSQDLLPALRNIILAAITYVANTGCFRVSLSILSNFEPNYQFGSPARVRPSAILPTSFWFANGCRA